MNDDSTSEREPYQPRLSWVERKFMGVPRDAANLPSDPAGGESRLMAMLMQPVVLFLAAIAAVLGIAVAASAGVGSGGNSKSAASAAGSNAFDAGYPNMINPCDLLTLAEVNDRVSATVLDGKRSTAPSGTKICTYKAQGAPSVFVDVSVGDLERFENEMTMFINFYSPLPGDWDRGYILCQQMCHAHILKDQTYIGVVLSGNQLSQDPEATVMSFINALADRLD